MKAILLGKSYSDSFKEFMRGYVKDLTLIDMNQQYKEIQPSFEPYAYFIAEQKPDILVILMEAREFQKAFY